MFRTLLCRIGLGLSLLSTTLIAHSDALLNGLSSHSELKKEKFIGALYNTRLTDDADIVMQAPPPSRMEIRVLAPTISKRRFNRMWIEGIAINSSGTTLTQQADNMVKFTSFFKSKLMAGDTIEFINSAESGTVVVFNKIELGNINNPEFFSLLLRAWIGKVPLSSAFRDGILAKGNIDKDLLARYNTLSPSDQRQQEIASWIIPKEPDSNAIAATTAIAATAIAKPKPVGITMPKIEAPTLAFNTPPAPAKPKAAKPVITSPAVTEDEDDADEDDRNDVAFTAESLLARQLYVSKMLRHAYGYIKYPSRAARNGNEGSVRLSVMVDREGRVKSILPIEESEFSSLNKAAWSAIEKADPFPAVPDNISGDDFEFSMPIVFRLQSR